MNKGKKYCILCDDYINVHLYNHHNYHRLSESCLWIEYFSKPKEIINLENRYLHRDENKPLLLITSDTIGVLDTYYKHVILLDIENNINAFKGANTFEKGFEIANKLKIFE